jgi:mevalonate kinase
MKRRHPDDPPADPGGEPGGTTEPGGGEPNGNDELAKLRADHEALTAKHDELLRAKDSHEETKREVAALREELYQMTHSELAGDPNGRDEVLSGYNEIRESGQAKDRFILALTEEVGQLKRKVSEVSDRTTHRIPEKYEKEVEVAMKSGDFTNRRAAYRAVLGDKLSEVQAELDTVKEENEKLAAAKSAGGGGGGEPVGTRPRPVPFSEAMKRGVIKASEWKAAMSGSEASEYLRRERSGALKVVPD